MNTTYKTITLLINNTLIELPWRQFVSRLEATATVQQLYDTVDSVFILQCATLVIFMQAGFLMVETGSVSNPNKVKNILLKNIGDVTLCALLYYLIGFGLAFGEGGPFVGHSGFAAYGPPLCTTKGNVTVCHGKEYAFMFLQLTFATSTGTIMSGAIAERMKLPTYCILSCILSCIIYPIVTRWVWSPHGWASMYSTGYKLLGTGVVDYAGSSTVHLIGSLPALILLPLLGPRRGRFDGDAKKVRLPGQNNYFTTIGTMLLWFSWYGFVCGSTRGISGTRGPVIAKIATNSTLSAVFSSILTIVWGYVYEKKIDSMNANNGILAGLVGITASCATCDTEAAVFIGIVSSFVYFGGSKMLVRAKLDDVVDALPIHGGCGLWGTIAAGIFSTRPNIQMAYPHYTNTSLIPCGALYVCDGLGIKLFAANLIYVICLIVWVIVPMCLIIAPFWWFSLLQSDKLNETDLDYGKHVSGMLDDITEENMLEPLSTIEEIERAVNPADDEIIPGQIETSIDQNSVDSDMDVSLGSIAFSVDIEIYDCPAQDSCRVKTPNILMNVQSPTVSVKTSAEDTHTHC